MKRFFIVSVLIVFVTVGSVGANKVGWAEPVWIRSQDEFEKDRKGCIESIDKNLTSEVFGRALEECMTPKGYQYQTSQNVERGTGPSVDGQTGWITSQGEFEKDREGCIESIDKNLDSEAFGKALEECMGKKGYQYQIVEKPDEPQPSPGMVVLYVAGVILLVPLAAAYLVLSALLL